MLFRSGDDNITGGPDADTIDGGEDFDQIYAGGGDDIVTGGPGPDEVFGGDDDDLIVSGRTNFNFDTLSLLFLRQEWISGALFVDRVAHLTGTPGGVNGPAEVIVGSTVFKDSDIDTITGGLGMDWFVYNFFQDLLNDSGDEETDLNI